jgi:putative addiction module CopG family antidote
MHLELALSDEALAAINERVASGEFASPSAVVEAALALLARVEAQERERMRTALAEGEEDATAGRVQEADVAFFAEIRARVAALRRGWPRSAAGGRVPPRVAALRREWPRSAASDSCLRDPTHC